MPKYVYGKNVVSNLLKNNGEILNLYVLEGRNPSEIEKKAKDRRVNIRTVSRKYLDKLVDGNHQGYVAEVREYKTYSIDEITDSVPGGKLPLIVALDGVQDPHNLGAVLRTMACVGGDGVIIEKDRSVSLNGTVAKVSVGAIDTIKVAQVTNLAQTLRKLKEKGYWVVGTDMDNALDYRQPRYDVPIVLVIGAEGTGIRRLTSEICDYKIKLPMEGDIGSLNASVACGIILYQIYSQRSPL
ncbi:MAG: 23S rRNA (guanosine(2251)-2'-O)-methyltransferase RlmB [Erysipelotrichaceae bacterium]|nr:23S rRNA (guanosine(2251)-2'-O)-methyltransferase RlmB [Erysipelotrichaceae bacterium]